jgi:hypothetical protein
MEDSLIYHILLFLHILAAVAAIGLNFSYAIWIVRGQKDTASLAFALKGVKFVDDYIANPLYLLAFATGLAMILMGKTVEPFIQWAILLYLIAMVIAYAIYTPTLRSQIQTLEKNGLSSALYQTIAKKSQMIGIIMGVMVLVILALKIIKPSLPSLW